MESLAVGVAPVSRNVQVFLLCACDWSSTSEDSHERGAMQATSHHPRTNPAALPVLLHEPIVAECDGIKLFQICSEVLGNACCKKAFTGPPPCGLGEEEKME